MSGRKLDAPLAVQAASLKKTMQNREKRRHSDKAQRAVGHPRLYSVVVSAATRSSGANALQRESEDGAAPNSFAQRRTAGGGVGGNATGGVQLGSTARTANYAVLPEPCVLRCTLCQVLLMVLASASTRQTCSRCCRPALGAPDLP